MSSPQKNPNVAQAQQKASDIANQVLNHPYVKRANAFAQQNLNALDKQLSQYPVLTDLEARTNVPKTYGVLILTLVAAASIFLNVFGLAQVISQLIGYLPAAYFSAKALETPSPHDDKQWLTYWLIFGLFTVSESILLRAILYYFPFYFVTKTVFIIWLMLPQTRGAEVTYRNVVSKVFTSINSSFKTSKPISPVYGGAQPYSATTTSTFDHDKSL